MFQACRNPGTPLTIQRRGAKNECHVKSSVDEEIDGCKLRPFFFPPPPLLFVMTGMEADAESLRDNRARPSSWEIILSSQHTWFGWGSVQLLVVDILSQETHLRISWLAFILSQ
jgi:hypothetical protein